MTPRRALALAIPLALVLVAGTTRLLGVDHPPEIIFDETYYVGDARTQLEQGVEDGFAVHPPLGKWLIAAGMVALGDQPLGWRLLPALAGIAVVPLTYLLAGRLLGRRDLAAVAGLLAAVDGLLVVQSRIAMLDGLLVLFVVLGAWLLVIDRDRYPPGTRLRSRPVLLLAGLVFGVAVATKWSGLLALAAAGLVFGVGELARHHASGWEDARPARAVGRVAVSGVLALLVVPAVVYAVSWVPWLANYAGTRPGAEDCTVDGELRDPCEVGWGARLAGLAHHHVDIWDFHQELDADHPYRSPAWRWPILARPIVYYWEHCEAGEEPEDGEECAVAEGNAAEIIALGNPALWWPALLALVPLGVGAVRRERAALTVGAFWVVQYVPWLVVARPLFFFYMAPIVPFMAVGVAYGLRWVDRRWRRPDRPRWRQPGPLAAATLCILAVAAYAYFYPVLTGLEMDHDAVRHRWWFDGWV